MKKTIYCLLIAISFLIFTDVVSAEDKLVSECEYSGFKLKFNKEDWSFVGITSKNTDLFIYKISDESLENFNHLEKNICPVVHSCYVEGLGTGTYTYNIYPDDLDVSCSSPTKDICTGGDACNSDYEGSCPTYNKLKQDIADKYTKYIKTNQVSYLNDVNKKVDQLRGMCGNIMQYVDYDDVCFNSCNGLNNDLETIGILKKNTNSCGFSDTLLAWIKNIIRVIKYIIPVIVIVFGIVDFIKAIASDKDDEMKKAQGRFIKRLIAAALVFIVPFIIEFVLDKAGFINDECAVDLGKIGL